MSHSKCLELSRDLIRKPSVTPEDNGCQQLIGDRLSALGFDLEFLPFGKVTNLWARYGSGSPLLVLAGHTDVVPAGDLELWKHDPFSATIEDGFLYGRGAVDMKSSLAAMVCAVEQLFASGTKITGSLAFLITSDEEGDAYDGTVRVVDTLIERKILADYVLIGEPSSGRTTADTLRIGRRGSLTAWLKISGRQGHVAYPQSVINPVHALGGIIARLVAHRWDEDSKQFPATSFQCVSCHSDSGATNVVPEEAQCCFNFRFGNQSTESELKSLVEQMVSESGLDYEINWHCSAQPFISAGGRLHDLVIEAVQEIQGLRPQLSTGGGTSDGRFLIRLAKEIVELGPCNATIHQTNERIALEELDKLVAIYGAAIEKLVCNE